MSNLAIGKFSKGLVHMGSVGANFSILPRFFVSRFFFCFLALPLLHFPSFSSLFPFAGADNFNGGLS